MRSVSVSFAKTLRKSAVMQVSRKRFQYCRNYWLNQAIIGKENLIPINFHVCAHPDPAIPGKEFPGKIYNHCFVFAHWETKIA